VQGPLPAARSDAAHTTIDVDIDVDQGWSWNGDLNNVVDVSSSQSTPGT
jgi:hypothetical protein